jgi:hypothetical protein
LITIAAAVVAGGYAVRTGLVKPTDPPVVADQVAQ